MASEGSRAVPKMAAAGAQGRARTETLGPVLPGRQRQRQRRPLGCCAKRSPEGERPATASAQPAGEEPPEACRQERDSPRTPSPCSPHKVVGRRPSKRLKYEKNSTVKSELEGLPRGSENLAALGEIPKASDGVQLSEDPGDHSRIPQKKSESIPEADEDKQEKEQNVSLKPHAVKPNRAPPNLEGDEDVHVCSEEERSSESLLSEGSSVEDADLPKQLMQLDSSAFLNEDSNQPMPVARFFGDVEDLPAAALPSRGLSRREYRRLHFIAKEEEEEEEDVVQQQTVNN